MSRPGMRSGRFQHRLRETLLNLAAAGGAVCLIAVVLAVAFNITLILFKTGSMSPTIPAGSLAVVREIPAAEVKTGDIVTVDRPGKLPITHRIQNVEPAEGAARAITMKGDANAEADPAPYVVERVRIVLWSVPGLAYPLAAVANPVVLGATTVCVAALVSWVLWPRNASRRGSRRKRGHHAAA
ncbi:signal peptidase I [Paenarthrobacter nitroguajacolicus]|uniref:signal peptidase I n=1 Tax=Paenarthrobacter nitroguajacolicus TaxID=211146 RepID=UPI002117C5D1|nr:signal peptidase I [Paenarthrobacter nitroguajacolicus]